MLSEPYPYKPKCVMITGATGDFGRAFAVRFASVGARIVLVGRNGEKVAEMQQEFRDKHNVKVHACIFDMADKAGMEREFANIPESFRHIDLLINNAGLALGLDKAYEADIDDWETMVSVNCTALMRMSRLVLTGMAHRRCGHIINIGSIAGNYPYPGGNVYCASKAFVKQFSLALRADLQGTNVRVTNIEPGAVETQFSAVRFKGDTEKAEKVYENTNNLQAEDIAETVFWAATLPSHVNINRLEVMATVQSFGPNPIERFD